MVVFYFISWTGRTQSAMKLDKYCFQNESGHRMIVCIGKLANEYNITLELMPGQQLYWLNYMFQDVRGRGCNPLTIKLIYRLLRMVNWRPTSPLRLELVALKAVCQYRHIVDRTTDMRKYGYLTVGDWSPLTRWSLRPYPHRFQKGSAGSLTLTTTAPCQNTSASFRGTKTTLIGVRAKVSVICILICCYVPWLKQYLSFKFHCRSFLRWTIVELVRYWAALEENALTQWRLGDFEEILYVWYFQNDF